MTAREFIAEKDYPDLCEWWTANKWPAIPLEFLSPKGVVIEREGKKISAGFVYVMPGCKIASFEWLVTNPKAGLKEKFAAIELTLDAAKAMAKNLGATACWTTVKHDRLSSIYQDHGFQIQDTGVTHFIAGL